MRGKYFKLKVLAIASFSLIAIGFTGSYKMFCEVQRRVDEEIELQYQRNFEDRKRNKIFGLKRI